MSKQKQLALGDRVCVCGQSCIGEIVKITPRHATIVFGAMEVSMDLRQLEKVSSTVAGRIPTMSIASTVRDFGFNAHVLTSFNPEIDLHGMSVSMALSAIDQWLDKAFLLGYRQLKIIHGKGMGILRKAIRTHLQSHSQVKNVVTKHPYPGGEGVTWIEVL